MMRIIFDPQTGKATWVDTDGSRQPKVGLDHENLLNKGVNNHQAIDAHIGNDDLHGEAGASSGEVHFTPKSEALVKAKGTMFFCDADNGIYVGVE